MNMTITKLSIENFKKFKTRFEFDFLAQNFLVGENNTGKTSVIESVDYLLSGPKKDKKYKNLEAGGNEYIVVEAILTGDFSNIDSKYKDYVFQQDDVDCIKLRRSDEEKKIDQSGKEVTLNESKILCWSEERKQFENPAGRATTFNVIDVVSIYANDHVDQVVSFDSTKILGKLIKSSVGDFFDTYEYMEFKEQHDTVFNTGPNSLKSRLNTLAKDISEILKEQWGELELGFKFDLTDNSSHLKKGSVLVTESGVEHELEDKGSGLQRSVMLSMIQALSKVYASNDDSNIILCIDEPELNLHPRAQEKLALALSKLSKNIQIIVSTHSPYMLRSFKKDADKVYIFEEGKSATVKVLDKLSILPFGPTLAEIQYFAYNLTSHDLHNELYGYLQAESKTFDNSRRWLNEDKLKIYATGKGVDINTISDTEKERLKFDVSLQVYIRHSIHHPENTRNDKPTEAEIYQSITEMINIL